MPRSVAFVRVLLLLAVATACRRPDPIELERILERDQLRREVAGFRALEKLAPGKVIDRSREVVITVSDSLLRSLVQAAFPLTIEIRNRAVVTLTGATVQFRANVARVDLTGTVRRTAFPQIAAQVTLRGALDKFVVDSTHALRARISVDDASLETPSGAPAPLDPLVIAVLRGIVERSLPELTSGLPTVAVPVRLDERMALPGFGPEGALSIEPSSAPISVEALRVIAFQNRLWIVLRVELGGFSAAVTAP
ncbi:MAG: hypothetical protein IT355_20940 [Gemmatimonadaceae bacterium]|nr:hypothetical protein [Gemmatimonadaceae bacterium]